MFIINVFFGTGDKRNEYLYAGEQYNAETGLYYNSARYMDPTTGTFISMDSYSGSIYDPVSLHKYLYANANPVTYTDPTGYFSFTELMVTQKIQGVINSIQMSSGLFKVLRWVNAIVSVYDVFQQIKGFVEEGMSVEEIVVAMAKDCTIDALLDGLCSTKIGFILKPVLFVFSLGVQMKQLEYAWTEGTTMDKIMYTAQAIAMIFGLAQQCFTGDTLVWTENGTIAISEVAIGDEVYAYDAETGEAILAKVTDISVSETDELVHLTIDGELIRTTASHPFYTASGEWKAAGDLMVGDRVVTMTGEATVEATEVEKLAEAVTVYNLTVEGEHNYYVAENGVLVHNDCDVADSANKGGKTSIVNSKGASYPEVTDIRTGQNMVFPDGVGSRVSPDSRVGWYRNQSEANLYRTNDTDILCKKDYIDEWYRRGYQTPEGGWDLYEIHHIMPREFGGGADLII